MRSLVLLLVVGCTPGVYTSMAHKSLNPTAPVAPARVDLEASEVYIDAEGFGGDASGDDIRNAVGQALQEYLGGNAASNAPPARFRLVGRTSVTGAAIMWLVPCFFYFTVLGCPVNIQSAHVELTLQVGQRKYTGAGDARGFGGLYYNHNTRGVLGRAAAEAVEQIFDNARLK